MRIIMLGWLLGCVYPTVYAMRTHQTDLRRFHTMATMDFTEFKHMGADDALKIALGDGNQKDVKNALQLGANFKECNPIVYYFQSLCQSTTYDKTPTVDHAFVRWLIKQGAPVNPLEGASIYSPLTYALQMCRVGCCVEALLQAGAYAQATVNDIEVMPFLKLPICVAIEKGNLSYIKLLVDHGAVLTVISGTGKTLLHYAVEASIVDARDKQEIISYFCKNNVDAHAFNKEGLAPLHVAIKKLDIISLQSLINEKVNVYQLNAYGKSPQSLALAIHAQAIKDNDRIKSAIAKSIIEKLLLACAQRGAHPNA